MRRGANGYAVHGGGQALPPRLRPARKLSQNSGAYADNATAGASSKPDWMSPASPSPRVPRSRTRRSRGAGDFGGRVNT
jgi:hypothetical protein